MKNKDYFVERMAEWSVWYLTKMDKIILIKLFIRIVGYLYPSFSRGVIGYNRPVYDIPIVRSGE
jgi:hypothetical protein